MSVIALMLSSEHINSNCNRYLGEVLYESLLLLAAPKELLQIIHHFMFCTDVLMEA